VRTTIAARAAPEAVSSDSATAANPETDDAPSFAKADKLPSVDFDVMKKKVSVLSIEVASAERKTKTLPKAEEATSWHWHAGSKISKRTGKPVPAQ
jgi:hypothetical protein